jgi:5-methylcytosine-specific restriction protein A
MPLTADELLGLMAGKRRQVFVNQYERNPEAREKCIAYYKAYSQVCGLKFEEHYGGIGKGFIHVHHLVPVSKRGQEYNVDPIKDMRPVCPNCHAMLHKSVPPYTIEKLKSLVMTYSKRH